MAAETDSPVRHMLFMDVVVKATYDHFKKWWAQYEADISSTPMTSTRGVAFDAWLAAIKLVEEKFTANNTPAMPGEAPQEIVEIQDSYQYKLDDLRGRVRGLLQGQLTRFLQTALDASRSDPPWTKAIQERLEDALKLIDKEIQKINKEEAAARK